MLSAKWQPFCLSLNVLKLMQQIGTQHVAINFELLQIFVLKIISAEKAYVENIEVLLKHVELDIKSD